MLSTVTVPYDLINTDRLKPCVPAILTHGLAGEPGVCPRLRILLRGGYAALTDYRQFDESPHSATYGFERYGGTGLPGMEDT